MSIDWETFGVTDESEPPPGFDASEWVVLKATLKRVHAQHESGVERKLPKAWFE